MKESSYIEFKSSFNDAVIETLSAFANTKGGKVRVGVDNNGLPLSSFSIGTETLQNWINEIKNKTQPGIIADADVKKIKGKTVVEISIQEFPVKPIAFKSRYYKRVNNANHLLSTGEVSNLYMQSMQLSWDSYPYQKTVFKDLALPKIKAFINKVNDGGRFTLPTNPQAALTKLKLISTKEVSNAAMILFSKTNLQYNVHVGRFKTPSLIIDDKLLNGGLYDVLEESMQFIISHLKVAFEVKGKSTQRVEIFEYPLPALREMLLNALVHRDYSSPSDVQIKIFDKKISFFNPGKLFGNIALSDLKSDRYASQTRNKLLAESFYLTKDIEKYGSGFLRIRKEIKEYPTMKFNYSEQGNGFLAELEYSEQRQGSSLVSGQTTKASSTNKKNVTNNVTNNVTDNVTDIRLNVILELLSENARISINSLAEKVDVTKRTILRDLEKLKSDGQLVRLGSSREGYWKVLKKKSKKINKAK